MTFRPTSTFRLGILSATVLAVACAFVWPVTFGSTAQQPVNRSISTLQSAEAERKLAVGPSISVPPVTLVSGVDPGSISDAGGAESDDAVVSRDGRYMAFTSQAPNLFAGQIDGNHHSFLNCYPSGIDVFLRDRVTGTTLLVSRSVASPMTTGSRKSFKPTISADGRYVTFLSYATDLVPGQVNTVNCSKGDVFVYDRISGTTTLVSRSTASATTTGNGDSTAAVISADGNFIVFASQAGDLVAGQTDVPNTSDIFVYNRALGTTMLVSRSTASPTTTGNAASSDPSVSDDGRFIAFLSNASNLVAGQSGTAGNVFVYDRVLGTTALVSHSSASLTTAVGGSKPFIGGDGNFIAYGSSATNLVVGQADANNQADVFLFDRQTGVNTLVSRSSAAATTTGNRYSTVRESYVSYGPDPRVVNANGRFVVFESYATDLVAGQIDQNTNSGGIDVFVYDRVSGTTTLVSRSLPSPTTTAATPSSTPQISDDGQFIVFLSAASDLLPGVFSGQQQVFLFDRQTATTRLVSHAAGSSVTSGNFFSSKSFVSGDGNFIGYSSRATNLVAGVRKPTLQTDVFLYDQLADSNSLVSLRDPSLPSRTEGQNTSQTFYRDSDEYGPESISADGRYVAFIGSAPNLIPGYSGFGGAQVFLFDRMTGTKTLVSRSAALPTMGANSNSLSQVVSANGRYVAYLSWATDLIAGQTGGGQPFDFWKGTVFLFDRVSETTMLVSHAVGSATTAANRESGPPSISADGRYIAFESYGTNLIAGQTDMNGEYPDIFLFDRVLGTTTLVSHAVGSTATTANNSSIEPSISADGRYITFASSATNLVAGVTDTNNTSDIFVHDRVLGTTTLVSHSAAAATTTANKESFRGYVKTGQISADGNFIFFQSFATNLVAGQDDANQFDDVFLHDRTTGANILVSRAKESSTRTENARSSVVALSTDGNVVVFARVGYPAGEETGRFVFDRVKESVTRIGSHAYTASVDATGNLIAFDETENVVVYNRQLGTTTLVSRTPGSSTTGGNGPSRFPVISQDGKYIVFQSLADNLTANDFNTYEDIFLAELQVSGCTSITGTVTGGGTICAGGTSTVSVTLSGGTPPYSVTLSNGGGTRSGNSPLVFTVSPSSTTAYSIQSGTDATGCPITGSGSATVTVNQPPTTANAGADQTVCNGSSATLAANNPATGTGVWSVVSGPSTAASQFGNVAAFNSSFSPAGGGGVYTLRWTVALAPCPNSTDDMVLTVRSTPTPANAGPDQAVCGGAAATLAANNPTSGTGSWSVVSGPSTASSQFSSTISPTATFTPAGGAGAYTLRWTIANPPCAASSDDVLVTVSSACSELSVLYVADTQNHRVQKFNGSTWSVVVGSGVPGVAPNFCNLPEAVTASTDGSRIYVADTGNNRVTFSTDSGATWAVFASSGVGLGQVAAPQGLALDLSGNLYVADTGNNRVLRFAGGLPGSAVVLATSGVGPGQVSSPRGLAVDRTFNLFIADRNNHRILKVANAHATATPNTGTTFVSGPGVGLNQVTQPEGVGVDDAGNVHVADTGNNRVMRFAPAGGVGVAQTTGTGGLLGQVNQPEGVSVGRSSTGTAFLLVGDTGNNRVQGRPVAGGAWRLIGTPNNLGGGVGQFRAPSKIR